MAIRTEKSSEKRPIFLPFSVYKLTANNPHYSFILFFNIGAIWLPEALTGNWGPSSPFFRDLETTQFP